MQYKFSLVEAYLQIKVATESRELLTINTHRGLFQYTKLPFGIKTASAIFQQITDTMISGLLTTIAYLTIVMGCSPKQLQERVITLLQCIQEYGFNIRAEKCTIFVPSNKCLACIFGKNGHRPDPEKPRAITERPRSTDITRLRSFLGLISYFSSFLPSLHNVRAPLNEFLNKNSKWNLTPKPEKAFTNSRDMLTSAAQLSYYNNLPIIVGAGASDFGAVISYVFSDNSEKVFAHTSQTPKKNFSQIEKEFLWLFAV